MNPIRCQIRWITYEHPFINRNEWSYSENIRLKELAKLHNEKNWNLIAEYLKVYNFIIFLILLIDWAFSNTMFSSI